MRTDVGGGEEHCPPLPLTAVVCVPLGTAACAAVVAWTARAGAIVASPGSRVLRGVAARISLQVPTRPALSVLTGEEFSAEIGGMRCEAERKDAAAARDVG
jgi:hypothetical protein